MTHETYPVTQATRARRLGKRARYDVETVHAILDEALVCHVAVIAGGRPRVLPTLHWRIGRTLHIHGARKNGIFQAIRAGSEASVAATILDGLVLARSAFHHSANYRSVVAFGRFSEITDRAEAEASLAVMMDKIHPGRWQQARLPTAAEMQQTSVLKMDLVEVSAKIRQGPPIDDAEDYALPVWAGVMPLSLVRGEPISDPTPPPPLA